MNMAKIKLLQLSQHGDLLDRYGASVRVLGQRKLVKEDVLQAINQAVQMTSHNTSAILNVCFPYTSHDEITTAIRNTVIDYSTPTPLLQRPFSESHIAHTIRSRYLSAVAAPVRTDSPSSSCTSDTEDSLTATSSSITLNSASLPEAIAPTPGTDQDDLGPLLKPQRSYPDPETITAETLDEHMFTAGLPPLDLLVRTSGVERLSDFMLWQCHRDTEIVFLKCLWPEFDLWAFLPVLVEWQYRRRKRDERVKGVEWGKGEIFGS